MKNKKSYALSILFLTFLLGGCTSAHRVSGQVYSNTGYEMMGKEVSFSQYGSSALNKETKNKVEIERLKFLNEVDEYFSSDEGIVNGTLGLYSKKQ